MVNSVWILENSYVVYVGLKHIIEGLGDFIVESPFESLANVEEYARVKRCHILLCNPELILNVQSLTKLKILNPFLRILIIDHGDGQYKNYMDLETVDGYLLLCCQMKEILKAVTLVSRGQRFFCEKIAGNILSDKSSREDLVFLTDREVEILKLIAQGHSSQEISENLFLSFHTITTHRKNICKKLKVNKVSELIACAYKMKIV